ncbi:MAG: hypothetical protein ACFB10_25810 [Salibacteraceae bacterium]
MKTLLLFLGLLLCAVATAFSQASGLNQREARPQVVAVFPSADTLPANLLRMYVHFSTPMKPLGNLENIQVVDAAGNVVAGALFNNDYELWNHEQTQLTLLLDPSRVKTGLQANEARGRALVMGSCYRLQVGELEDAQGRTTAAFSKSFFVGPEDRQAPNTDLWVFNAPKAGSRDSLIVRFPEMLDRLSMVQRLQLANENKQAIPGRVVITENETTWCFIPNQDWVPGDYTLYVHGRLEDPAGNNLDGLFDHPPGTLKNKVEGTITTIPITIIP